PFQYYVSWTLRESSIRRANSRKNSSPRRWDPRKQGESQGPRSSTSTVRTRKCWPGARR
ncbi:hypothetical protein B0H17DRAFT_1110799, partial [Mycena rosella]